MFHPMAAFVGCHAHLALLPANFLKHVQDIPIGPVADGVDAAGNPAAAGQCHKFEHFLLVHNRHAVVVGFAGVWFGHGRGPGTQGTVGEQFQAPNGEPRAAHRSCQSKIEGMGKLVLGHMVYGAQPQLSRPVQPLECLESLPAVKVVN